MTGLHDSITILFLIVGHTKFAPNGCFGLLKREFRRTEVSCLADLEQVVQSSAVVNKSQLVGSQTGESIVPMKDWAGFLGPHFQRLTGIKHCHHFRFDKNTPGVVHLRLHSDSPEEKRRLMKDQNWNTNASDLPPIIPPSGMSLERQQYLFEKIREFCRDGTKDLVCPDPTPSPRLCPCPPSPQNDPSQYGEDLHQRKEESDSFAPLPLSLSLSFSLSLSPSSLSSEGPSGVAIFSLSSKGPSGKVSHVYT